MKPFRAQYLVTVTGEPANAAVGCGDRAMEERTIAEGAGPKIIDTVEMFWQTFLREGSLSVKCLDARQQAVMGMERADQIISWFQARAGFRGWWDGIDPETQAELRADLAKIFTAQPEAGQ